MAGQRIELVYVFRANYTIKGLGCEKMLAAENYDGGLIQIDLLVRLPHHEIWYLVQLHTTLLTVFNWTVFATKARTLMTTVKKLGTALVTWKPVAGS